MKKVIGFKGVLDILGKKEIKLLRISEDFKNNKKVVEILNFARNNKIDYEFVKQDKIFKIEALLDEKEFTFSSALKLLQEKSEAVVLVLDHIQDIGNFGSIIRTAEAFGINYIIIPNKNSVKVNDTVIKISAGAFAYIEIIEVPNLTESIERLKEIGFWIYGTDIEASKNFKEIEYSKKCCIVMGSEESGMKKRVQDSCDFLVKIPMKGKANSLNVAVACGIILAQVTGG